MNEIQRLGVDGLGSALLARTVSAREAADAYLEAISVRDGEVGAYLTVTGERAMADAARYEREGASSPLAGIPFALKDNLCTEGIRTTCASKMLAGFVPPYTATAAERLADGVLLGKLNMDEFAMGSSTENSAFQVTRNPADLSRVPGGSSGGSAAAVAAGLCAYALGSDTGGSIRQPAAFCGCVGMKPTYGRVSRYGLVAFASSLDQIGPLTRSVRDNALVLNAIAGHDPRDATSLDAPAEDFTARLEAGVQGLRVGLPEEWLGKGCSEAVRSAVRRAAAVLEGLGADVSPCPLPSLEYALPAYYVLSGAEASSNLSRFDGVKYGFRAKDCETPEDVFVRSRTEGFGAEVKRRILLGAFVLSAGYYDAYYKRAQQARTLICRAFDEAFTKFDLILSPVAPTTAWRFGEKADPLQMYLGDVYTVPASIAGLPALSLPAGRDADGLPVGAQLIGPRLSESVLYRAAYALESELADKEAAK